MKDAAFLKLPVFGPLFKKVALSRFAAHVLDPGQERRADPGAMEIVSDTAATW